MARVTRTEIKLDQFYPTIEVKFDSVDACMQAAKRRQAIEARTKSLSCEELTPEIPWWQPIRRMYANWLANKELVRTNQREELAEARINAETKAAQKAFDFIWLNRDTYTTWKHKYPAVLIEEKHPIIRLLEHKYRWTYDGEIPTWIKMDVWVELLDRTVVHVPDHALYTRMCRKMITELGDIMEEALNNYRGRFYSEITMADGLGSTKYESLRRIEGEWTINIGGKAVPVRLGGRPSTVDLIVEPFYRFDAEGMCSIAVERGSINPVRIYINESFEIVSVKRLDSSEELDGFSIREGHVLLDMLMVHVPASRAINGNSSKTR
jgi:hypothetical protein